MRDSYVLMYPIIWLLYRKHTRTVMEFKSRAHDLSRKELVSIYAELADWNVRRDTDLNQASFDYILRLPIGLSALDVGCGKGFLLDALRKVNPAATICGVDFSPEPRRPANFVRSFVDRLPFGDRTFDTVICAHTLEHVTDFDVALSEIRRVCRNRLVVVVPKQKPYKYTFDLHLHFFPYRYDIVSRFRPTGSFELYLLQGDWIYLEDLTESH